MTARVSRECILSMIGHTRPTTGIFSGLTPDEMERLLAVSVTRQFAAGQMPVQQGDTPRHLFFILSGQFKTLRTRPEGDEAVLRMLKAGETFMDAVIFMSGQSPIAVAAMQNSETLMIPAGRLREECARIPALGLNLLRIVAGHYKTSLHQIDAMATKAPVQRLGYYLLNLFLEQNGDLHEQRFIRMPFPKAVTARHLGMTPETFSRALNRLRDSGLDIDGGTIGLADAFALCSFCDLDTAHNCPRQGTSDCPL